MPKGLAIQISSQSLTQFTQRSLAQRGLAAARRRAWLLQLAARELGAGREDAQRWREAGERLAPCAGEGDVEMKLDRCLSLLSKQHVSPKAGAASVSIANVNPIASSSVVSTASEGGDRDQCDEVLSSLFESPAAEVWALLLSRRAAAAAALAAANTAGVPDVGEKGCTPQQLVAHTAALHSSLRLRRARSRLQAAAVRARLAAAVQGFHAAAVRARLAAAVQGFHNLFNSEACEVLVLQCERARAGARLATLKNLLEDVTKRRGVFAAPESEPKEERQASGKQLAAVDRAIVSIKEVM
ncbi:unnamed protein product [Plutella xylostella]|uniref:(diamondback moth) hypothetical protein n=1 Tax=Plutella xylostella TaxID=51655 RepID=A0A8S4FAJ9_PLUXY|nr:unnamed protein product [Plutella xylostella]